ncbi:MAG: membrane protein insertase YidC [Pseudomonadota bacterium]
MDNSRNLLLAFVLCALLIFGWGSLVDYLYPQPDTPVEQADAPPGGAPGSAGSSASGTATGSSGDGIGDNDAQLATGPLDLDTALADPRRVKIDAPKIGGSINLVGAQVDDIVLKDHRETADKDSGPVRLLAPARTSGQYFAEFRFIANGKRLPDGLVWDADGEQLTPDSPVTLTAEQGDLQFAIKFSVDDGYMIKAEQSVTNTAEEAAAVIQPVALIDRTDANATRWEWLVHSGPMGVYDDAADYGQDYETLAEEGKIAVSGAVSWLGFSDRYWLSAVIPGDGSGMDVADASYRSLGDTVFRAGVAYDAVPLAPGASMNQTTQLFTGAKDSVILDDYEEAGITLFGKAISWGWFEIIEKPLLWLLRTLNGLIGNFGVAIVCMTLIIRGLLFPIAQKGFASMASMKAIQPKMKAIQERYKDDKQTQQQKIMELYKEEKVNPVAGCLPMLLQIPVFFALYKVLILAIEMRHEPFLYVADLTAPDPASLAGAMSLIGVTVPEFLMFFFGIGVLAVLLGVTMWLTFKLNPSAMDPMQQQIFNLMPWFLMFVMAQFAAGLLLYWVTSNVLTLAQQKYLYSKHPQLRAQAEKEKAEMAKKIEREKAEKSEA